MVIAALTVVPLPAEGGYYETGNDLLEICRNNIHRVCLGYAAGIADAAYFTPLSGICIPSLVVLSQVRDVIVDHLVAHPETRHEPAYYLANRALIAAWPCRVN
ncbi:MAG: hypothetical protein EON59_07250 [Alphaproteobacteria bacterium]|nr:MAG: hypothetical protein EON59_07250 [Alphaproteobacteria bacterium]